MIIFVQDPTLPQGFSSTFRKRFWSRVNKTASCWLWTGTKFKTGYGCIGKGADGQNEYAHRASWMMVNGPIPKGMFVCHNCPGGDNRACVNPDHLWLGSCKENVRDAINKGTTIAPPIRRGEQNHKHKLNADQVLQIRSLWPKIGQRKLARMFSVNKSTIQAIVRFETWRHVGVPEIKPVVLMESPAGRDPLDIFHK